MAALDNEPRAAFVRWIPMTALAGLVLIVVGVLVNRGINDVELPQMTADELAVIASEDELELFEELEFYVWFDQDENV